MNRHLVIWMAIMMLAFAAPATADKKAGPVEYYNDPIYTPLGAAEHPLEGLFVLAEEQDPRAQYILGDLYSKGKGGVERRPDVAKVLFEHSAKLGTYDAFIRLAALAKAEADPVAAYKWYDLAVEHLPYGPTQAWAERSRTALALESADIEKAKTDARKWKEATLEPLKLNHPMRPLKPEQTDTAAEPTPEEKEDTHEQN